MGKQRARLAWSKISRRKVRRINHAWPAVDLRPVISVAARFALEQQRQSHGAQAGAGAPQEGTARQVKHGLISGLVHIQKRIARQHHLAEVRPDVALGVFFLFIQCPLRGQKALCRQAFFRSGLAAVGQQEGPGNASC